MIKRVLISLSLVDEDYINKLLARALSEVTNFSSMTFKSGLTLSICSTEPQIPTDILVFMNIKKRRLNLSHFFIKTYSFCSAGFSNGIQLVFYL